MPSAIERQPPERPPHDWTLIAIINLTEREASSLADGQRAVLRKVDPYDSAQCRATAVKCARCGLTIDALGDGERDGCRG